MIVFISKVMTVVMDYNNSDQQIGGRWKFSTRLLFI